MTSTRSSSLSWSLICRVKGKYCVECSTVCSAAAINDLTAAPGSDLDAQIAALTAGNQVDAEMAKLRAEVGSGTPAPELGVGGAQPAESQEESK